MKTKSGQKFKQKSKILNKKWSKVKTKSGHKIKTESDKNFKRPSVGAGDAVEPPPAAAARRRLLPAPAVPARGEGRVRVRDRAHLRPLLPAGPRHRPAATLGRPRHAHQHAAVAGRR